MREAELYEPVKSLLEARGFEVKGEVGAADVVAVRGDEPPVVLELKTGFTLALYHQAVRRLALTDTVYIVVPRPTGKTARRQIADNLRLCRRLGLGLITVTGGLAEIRCDPGPYRPRKSKVRADRLLKAFARLQGDPNDGGATRHGLVTGYRQEALRCAAYLAETGPEKGAIVARAARVPQATRIMADNHYGWFRRVERGIYALTPEGRAGLTHWAGSWEGE
ncbi:DUF2161 domain-containing phosphodiesterase [Ovoidimarina sediminis]|uniref:DUF2161 domain-containing phosphodiesterase n=1 Tax=Ovoidimarina sediminis TaxID=3079856 RepID=UPI0029090D60|nr:DUF2161 family putative PD-(D/E)XK-type phosphodiesterase [Rhodophyticola sp. MJ-SS7]MDU8943370.1 DUF2161 family putative PD-(D/E)XK-type phosphodiesterase [Rhodophyticola sp. MJ-SS7]